MLCPLFLVAALSPVLVQQPALEQETGSVAGVVLDEAGAALADATVFALPEQDMRRQIRAQTNAQGRFVLKAVPAGMAYVHAYKESAGYPYNFFAFFKMPGQDSPPKVMVSARQRAAGVTIRMGVKAAALRLTVTDDAGAPLDGGAEFERPDLGRAGNYGTSLRSGQILLVPPVPFRLTVSRDGYADWHYGGPKWRDAEGLLTLQPGETRELAIALQLGGASASANTGAIQGTVFGSADEPIAGASVYAEYDDANDTRRSVTTTTHAGTFVINRLEPGSVRLWAWRSDLGYSQDVASPFFEVPGRQFPVVATVSGEVASTEIRLGPKNAYVHLLIEDTHGQAVKSDVRLVLSRRDSPELLERDVVAGRAFVAVPPVPVRIMVEAIGYATWRSDQLSTVKDGFLTLNPGQIMDVRVTLRASQ